MDTSYNKSGVIYWCDDSAYICVGTEMWYEAEWCVYWVLLWDICSVIAVSSVLLYNELEEMCAGD